MASRQGLKLGSISRRSLEMLHVASGMASRQGLKQKDIDRGIKSIDSRQWNGFPSGIETFLT